MVSASQLRAQWSQSFAPADRTLPAMLTRQAERFAQKPLLTAGETTWTYADAYEAVARCAGTLRSAGIQQGDRVSAPLLFRSTSPRADRSFSTSYRIAPRGCW
jgi:crotonobetaine/carnitine-CoA ligase